MAEKRNVSLEFFWALGTQSPLFLLSIFIHTLQIICRYKHLILHIKVAIKQYFMATFISKIFMDT